MFLKSKSHIFKGVSPWLLVALLSAGFLFNSTQSGQAASYIIVNHTEDNKIANDGNCSLREAIIAANKDKPSGGKPGECVAGSGADTIILPAGTYVLSRTDGGKEDATTTGDLDIDGDVHIEGDGADVTIIEGFELTDRVIHVLSGVVTISGVTIRNGNVYGSGGGIYNEANLMIINSRITQNAADEAGGALFNADTGTLMMVGSTVDDNTAVSAPNGIVIAGGTADFSNSTFTDDILNDGTTAFDHVTAVGLVQNSSGSFTMHNSILARCSGTFTSTGYNLVQDDTSCAFTPASSDLIGLDPLLELLTNNGGGTPTAALSLSSPALESGDPAACLSTDQRGVSRPQGITCDIGAFELENPPQQGPELFVNTNDDTDDGLCGYDHCSLREAIAYANSNPDTTTIRFDLPDGQTIELLSPLPTITEPVVIDGSSQTGGFVVLQPAETVEIANGLVIEGGASTITGLHIFHFDGDGILIQEAGNNVISGNSIAFNGGNGITILFVTGNQITGNNIHDNGGLKVDLGGDGSTDNDTNDGDDGANDVQNYPVLLSAVSEDFLTVSGRLNSVPEATYTVELFASETCNLTGGGVQTFLGSTTVTTDGTGDEYFKATNLTAVPNGHFIVSTATDGSNNTSEFSDCVQVGPNNTSWPNALPLPLAGDLTPTSVEQSLSVTGQSRWFKFKIEPGSRIYIDLSNLPANYDLTVYKDIGAAFIDLNTSDDLLRLGAEFASDAFSPDSFSSDAFSPDSFSPDSFSPDSFSPDSFSPDSFSPDSFSPDSFSPDSFSPDSFSPDSFSPDSFSPDSFSPDSFSTDAFYPDSFSPDSFSGAQIRALLAVSAFQGTASEGIVVNTWDNSGYYYARVRGANGAADPDSPFRLDVSALSGSCGEVAPIDTESSYELESGNFKTVILMDSSRLVGTPSEKAAVAAQLDAFAQRDEVAGVVVDVSTDARVVAANNQADAHLSCPYAKNLVVGTIRELVDRYWAVNELQYVMVVGDDGVIPFQRYPDNALLANEKNYVPPVLDLSSSQASLRLGYVLGQDIYGSSVNISSGNTTLPIPDLAVGRLVETAADVLIMLDAYMSTTDGQLQLNTSSLVTGYDFLEDVATAVQSELEAGMGQPADTLIVDRDLSPADPLAWTADDLRDSLLTERHDIIFLSGHFSAHSALAADYSTRMTTDDLINSSVDLKNALVVSAGCHAGYNLVDGDGIPEVTRTLDWAQAFAQKGTTLIAGTGYQYGDTDFIEYSERLYLEFSRNLRTGTGPVTIGEAMVTAKQEYLANTAQMRGIHEKALIEAALFGFPMLTVDMPGTRLTDDNDLSIVGPLTIADVNPGMSLGLAYSDISVIPQFSEHTVELTNVEDPLNPVVALYLAGSDGVVSNPVEPTLPLEMVNLSVPNTVLRGVGFRGGSYTDLTNILLLSGAPTTEIRGVHAPFQTDVFYPIVPWRINYFEALAESDGATRLAITPAQFRSNAAGATFGSLRRFDEMNYRVFYNSNVGEFANESIPALASPPSLVEITAVPEDGVVHFAMNVVNNPAVGVQEVWVTYTAISGPFAGTWQSLDLTQNGENSLLWEGTLDLLGSEAGNVRYIVQAVNGVGLVSMATNLGAYYTPGEMVSFGAPTELVLTPFASDGAYGSQADFTATLTSNGLPVADQLVSVRLGPQTRLAETDANGEATVTLSLLALPGAYQAKATFAGNINAGYEAVTTSAPFTINQQNTILTLEQPAIGVAEDDHLLFVTLTDATERPLGEKTIFFVLNGAQGGHSQAVITDYAGRAELGNLDLPPGTYTVNVYFTGVVPLHTGETATYFDERYLPTMTTGSLELLNQIPIANDDLYTADEDTPLVVAAVDGVLANDVESDGDELTAVLATQPQFGMVDLHSDGSFTYAPDPDFYGSDSFTYLASDGSDESNVATVTITVNAINDAPTAENDNYVLDQDSTIIVPAPGVLFNDSDVEGEALTAELVSGPTQGELTMASDGSFVYTPNAGYVGLDSFTYRAKDGVLFSNEATVQLTINFVNAIPNCDNAAGSVDAIWPANKEFYPVQVIGVTDADDDQTTITITAIYQDEPVGRGSNSPDGAGVGTDTAYVRAERDGNGNGRVYHIYFTADDGMGGTCTGEIMVPIVSHDQSGDVAAIDGGPLYDSTIPD